jgi:hypothetical protein
MVMVSIGEPCFDFAGECGVRSVSPPSIIDLSKERYKLKYFEPPPVVGDTMARIDEIHEEEVAPPKVNNASLGELKATSDDAIAPVWLSYTVNSST